RGWRLIIKRTTLNKLRGTLSDTRRKNMSVKLYLAWLMIVVFCFTVVPVPAYQSTTKKEDDAKAHEARRKQAVGMTDESIKNSQALRLPENRLRLLVATASA